MGWRPWGSDKSEAEASLEALQQSPTEGSGDLVDDEIFVTLMESPASRTPGSPLSCLNEGPAVRAGDRVQLVTSFRTQETSIASIVRDGVQVPVLEPDETAQIVLAGAVDLSDVYRTACLLDPGSPETVEPDGFLVQVHTAEQRGKDVYVVGKARGQVVEGRQTVVSPWTDPNRRFATIKAVDELPDGRVGVLLAKRDASTFEHGDEITAF